MSVLYNYDLVEAAKQNLLACFPELGDQQQLLSVISIAEQAHRGQTRRDGTPYIVHPLTVAAAVFNKVGALGWQWPHIKIATFAAILHDAIEDACPEQTLYTMLKQTGHMQQLSLPITQVVNLLTKRQNETYAEYMQGVINGNVPIAKIIKYYDMKDNMFGCYKELYDQNADVRQSCKQLRKYLKVFPDLKEAVEKIV